MFMVFQNNEVTNNFLQNQFYTKLIYFLQYTYAVNEELKQIWVTDLNVGQR